MRLECNCICFNGHRRSEPLSLDQLDFLNLSHVYGSTDESVLTGVSKYPTKPMQHSLTHIAQAPKTIAPTNRLTIPKRECR